MLLVVTVVRMGEVVTTTAPVPLAVETTLGVPVLATTPAPEAVLVGVDDRVAFFALEQ